jgi:hypothetical protein
MPASAAAVLGREIGANDQVGLRPEHLTPADAGSAVIQGKLELVENLGEYALVHLATANGTEFIAKTEKPPVEALGETLSFTIKPELAHYLRVSDLLCMSNLAHASKPKEHDNNDDFQRITGRAAERHQTARRSAG